MMIADIRKETGLSQSKFAKRFGIPVRTLQQWEQGRSTPPDYVVRMIAYIIELEEITHRSGRDGDDVCSHHFGGYYSVQ